MILPIQESIHALALLALAPRVFSSCLKAYDGPFRALSCTLVVTSGRRPESKWDQNRQLTNNWLLRQGEENLYRTAMQLDYI